MKALWDWLPPELRDEVLDALRVERRTALRAAVAAATGADRWDAAVGGVEDVEAVKNRHDSVSPAVRRCAQKQRGEARWNDLRVQAFDAAISALGGDADDAQPGDGVKDGAR